MAFNRSPFKQVATFTCVAPGSGAFTHAHGLTLDPNYTMLVFGGAASYDTTGFPAGNGQIYAYGINSTNILCSSFFGGGQVTVTVVEFYPYQLKQVVQYGVVLTPSGNPVGTQTISVVSSKAFVNFLGMADTVGGVQTDMASVTGDIVLSSTTQVMGRRAGAGGANFPDQAAFGFCVVDPY